jgi:hypothetical protein
VESTPATVVHRLRGHAERKGALCKTDPGACGCRWQTRTASSAAAQEQRLLAVSTRGDLDEGAKLRNTTTTPLENPVALERHRLKNSKKALFLLPKCSATEKCSKMLFRPRNELFRYRFTTRAAARRPPRQQCRFAVSRRWKRRPKSKTCNAGMQHRCFMAGPTLGVEHIATRTWT